MPDIPAFEQNLPPAPPKIHYNSDFNPFKVSSGGSGGGSYSRPKVEWEGLYGGLTKASKMNEPQQEPEMEWENSTLYANESVIEKGNLHLQFKGRFILTSVKSGLMLIDQHRAHIRVLFDRYMVQIKQKQGVSQGVLFPEILQLPASEAAVLQGIMDDLSAVGFDLSDLGGGSYGQVLSNEEMVSLVDSLFACPSPNYTPDGKTVLTTIKEEDIEKLFK